jgi:large subunit ribosomal protein L18e
LIASRINGSSLSVFKLIKLVKGQLKITVVVGTVTNDARILNVPTIIFAALKFSETARALILKVGGKFLTLDQLVLTALIFVKC